MTITSTLQPVSNFVAVGWDICTCRGPSPSQDLCFPEIVNSTPVHRV